MPRRPDKRGQMMPHSPGYPELIDEPVKPGPKPEEGMELAPLGAGPEGMPEGPPMPEGMQEGPPVPPEAMPGDGAEEGQLPENAAVTDVQDKHVVIIDDIGETRRIPKEAFAVEPHEGMLLTRAIVTQIGDGIVFAKVGDEHGVVEISKSKLGSEFEVGDFFWMPEPPKPPEGLSELEVEEEEEE